MGHLYVDVDVYTYSIRWYLLAFNVADTTQGQIVLHRTPRTVRRGPTRTQHTTIGTKRRRRLPTTSSQSPSSCVRRRPTTVNPAHS